MSSFTIEDIAKAAGVSTATVSRTINSPEKVKSPTRQKIEQVISRLGYKPNYFARGLRKQRTDSVGIIASFGLNPYLSEMLDVVERTLTQNGVYLYLCNCGFNTALEAKYTQELFRRNIDALMVFEAASFNTEDNYFLKTKFDRPVILVNQHTEPFGNAYIVRVDQAPGLLEAFDYVQDHALLPCFLLISPGSYSFLLKEKLCNAWKQERGLSDTDIRIIKSNKLLQTNEEGAVWHSNEVIKQALLSTPRPRCILAGNDLMAMGVLIAARELSIAVPDELAVIGVDNTLLSRISAPPLSTVDLRMRELGKLAAELYLDIKDSPDKALPQVQTLPSRLLLRSSTP
jgi:LacI family transcriptional regulator